MFCSTIVPYGQRVRPQGAGKSNRRRMRKKRTSPRRRRRRRRRWWWWRRLAAAEEDRRRTRGRRRWKGRKQRARKYLMLHEDGEGKEEFKLIVALPRPEHLPEPHDALIVELSPEAQ